MAYDVKDILARHVALRSEAGVAMHLADEVREVVDPSSAAAKSEVTAPSADYYAVRRLLDTTAMESCAKLAHGICRM